MPKEEVWGDFLDVQLDKEPGPEKVVEETVAQVNAGIGQMQEEENAFFARITALGVEPDERDEMIARFAAEREALRAETLAKMKERAER